MTLHYGCFEKSFSWEKPCVYNGVMLKTVCSLIFGVWLFSLVNRWQPPAMTIQTAGSPKTLIPFYQATRRHIPKDWYSSLWEPKISQRVQLVGEINDLDSCEVVNLPVVVICVWARALVCASVGTWVCVCNVIVLITCKLASVKLHTGI